MSSANLEISPEAAPEFQNQVLLQFSTTFERPHSPDRDQLSGEDSIQEIENWDEIQNLGDSWVNGVSVYKWPAPPLFALRDLQIIYFDVYGTPLDHESGIFEALRPLLVRSSYKFGRHEALSLYLDIESEVKRRTPTTPYLGILSQARTKKWPYGLDLQSAGINLIALADIDIETLFKTTAFSPLQPYFVEIWS
ncbi:hypothetical protein B0H16DRAFT_1832844 [Mycena metata]|uniref:Uncharacterized protein n=1 Tax=Mycena metata TaxID=1033252 RepID=A0AAD7DY63_9AGAR|nr:hypothetical protein B0H16DRAFT_1832844 [Mycena metata]